MTPKAFIVSSGSELTSGELTDTNGPWLAQKLTALGFLVQGIRQTGDVMEDLVEAIQSSRGRVQLVLWSGGLGPTSDDLTNEAFGKALRRPLLLDQEQLDRMKMIFQMMSRAFPETNVKQARIPEGAKVLLNNHGTAPGWAVEDGGTLFAVMPGVPRELKPMFEDYVAPLLRERFTLAPRPSVQFNTLGLPESRLQEMLTPLETRHPNIFVRYGAHWGKIEVKLSWKEGREAGTDADFQAAIEKFRQALGTHLIGEGDTSIEEAVGKVLKERGATLATAESCTGGLVSRLVTRIPGSSEYFERGFVTYSNEAKIQNLGVPKELIVADGAVSEEVARAMAEGVRKVSGTTYGLSTTGIAGPTGATPEKPVGLVYLGVSGPEGSYVQRVMLPGAREQVQERAASVALYLLWRFLTGNIKV